MTEREKLELLEDMLELDEGVLKPETLLEDVEGFDSMAHLSLIVLFEDEFEKKITGKDVQSFTTISDILKKMDEE